MFCVCLSVRTCECLLFSCTQMDAHTRTHSENSQNQEDFFPDVALLPSFPDTDFSARSTGNTDGCVEDLGHDSSLKRASSKDVLSQLREEVHEQLAGTAHTHTYMQNTHARARMCVMVHTDACLCVRACTATCLCASVCACVCVVVLLC